MYRLLFFLLGILLWHPARVQNMDVLQIERLTTALHSAKDDTTRALVMTQFAEAYRDRVTDSTLYYAQKALELSREIKFSDGETKALLSLSYYFFNRGNLGKGLELGLKGLELARFHKLWYDQAFAMIRVGNVYMHLKDYREALSYYHQTRELTRNSKDSFFYAVTFWRAADAYSGLNMLDSALFFAKKAEDTARGMGNKFILSGISAVLGDIYSRTGNDSLALLYLRSNDNVYSSLSLAEFFNDHSVKDSAIFYANKAYKLSVDNARRQMELSSANLLSSLYESSDPKAALRFLKIAMAAKDSLYGAEKIAAVNSIDFEERERQNELRHTEMTYRNRIKIMATLAGLVLVFVVAIILFRNNRKEKKANALLHQQKNEISKTLADLRATQLQLIQSEKMASLGQMTAGIAHEIQNPLNFVNNFSELNMELVGDLQEELKKGDIAEASLIADSLKDNEAKINLHGRRADGIVKSMLQHSSGGSGQKQMTDINKLVNEYAILAGHGNRGKQNEMHVVPDLDLEPEMGSLSLVSQDIGKVLLNLLNNAFYAVAEKSKSGKENYIPMIHIRTRRNEGKFFIEVADNGNGIPEKIHDKIFQPFFTTKPTGQATGLGLSLSYDIIKAHGYEIHFNSIEGEGVTFVIELH